MVGIICHRLASGSAHFKFVFPPPPMDLWSQVPQDMLIFESALGTVISHCYLGTASSDLLMHRCDCRPHKCIPLNVNSVCSQVSFPWVGSPRCPRPLQGHLTRQEVWWRESCSAKKQHPIVVQICSFQKFYKNTGPWEHNAGALPRALEGPEQLRGLAFELPLLWRACGGLRGAGQEAGEQLRAADAWRRLYPSLSHEHHKFLSVSVFPSVPAPVDMSLVPLQFCSLSGEGSQA